VTQMSKKNMPLYKTIENDLIEKIESGYYKPDEMIPTEFELTKIYKASRVTIRKATDGLVARNLLIRTAGLGSIIKPSSYAHKSVEHLSFSEEIRAQGKTPRFEVTLFTVQEAPTQIANILKLSEREMIYYFERACYCDDDIIQFEKTYMSIRKFPDLSISYLEKSKFFYIEQIKDIKIDISTHTVVPVLPSLEIAKMFKIDKFTPILKINLITYLKNGDVMDYTEQYLNSQKYQAKYVRIR
jgi:DNA-binding GntR family transcriptional regulator